MNQGKRFKIHHRTNWSSRRDSTVKKIIELVKEQWTLRGIAKELGTLTAERVRQGIIKIKNNFGEDILKPTEYQWNARKAAELLQCKCDLIMQLCRSGAISGCKKRTDVKNGRWLISETGMEELRQRIPEPTKDPT